MERKSAGGGVSAERREVQASAACSGVAVLKRVVVTVSGPRRRVCHGECEHLTACVPGAHRARALGR
jgi:hypothetical protein